MITRAEETDDAFMYVTCYRCGINVGMFYEADTVFCRDCNHPDLIGVFRLLDYSYIFESEAA